MISFPPTNVLVHCVVLSLFLFLWCWILFFILKLHVILLLSTPKALLIWRFSPRKIGRELCNKALRAESIFYCIFIFEWQFSWIKPNFNSKLLSFKALKLFIPLYIYVSIEKSGVNLVHFPRWGISFWKLLEFSLHLNVPIFWY